MEVEVGIGVVTSVFVSDHLAKKQYVAEPDKVSKLNITKTNPMASFGIHVTNNFTIKGCSH